MEEKCYKVYMHITPNGKYYIGITKDKPERRWGKGKNYKNCVLFYRAIQKYGWSNIEHKIILTELTKKQAEHYEQELIMFFKSNNKKYGYNISNGGCVNSVSEQTKQKLREKSLGKTHKVSEEIKLLLREKNLGSKNPMFGKKPWNYKKSYSLETRKKMSDSKKGKASQKRKKVLCVETNKIYESIIEATKLTNINNISRCCSGVCKKAGGYHWQYYEIEKKDEE